MTDKKDTISPDSHTGNASAAAPGQFRSPALAWISLALMLLAWAALQWIDGYVAMGVAVAAVVAGIAGMPGRSRGVRNIAITAVIASLVLLVVLAAFLIVIKIGLQA